LMIRLLALAALMSLCACSSQYHELAHTSQSDPVWQLNDGKWTFNENALIQPPAEVAP
jgi:outer membrane biogenesis lipoprotein LolB